ncbi:AGAP010541-PA-like protein [Anopheles sinensis]|uniref:AGAP010541-PA-like protein n=1 Tax=Anopheles sinensis TaxID=74873 RepID=A0A084WAU9_ANOSI|nr:AGAP010541-PA-like protein [Anopheles sinensis]
MTFPASRCNSDSIETDQRFCFRSAVPTATIIGGPDLHVDKGSTINLTCAVKYSPEPPAYIFWYHHDEVISYDSSRGGVSVITEKGDVTTSHLLIQNADLDDSGKYSCSPSNADVASVRVHVLNGEHPEAMQTGGVGAHRAIIPSDTRLLLAGLLLLTVAQLVVRQLHNLFAPTHPMSTASPVKHKRRSQASQRSGLAKPLETPTTTTTTTSLATPTPGSDMPHSRQTLRPKPCGGEHQRRLVLCDNER